MPASNIFTLVDIRSQYFNAYNIPTYLFYCMYVNMLNTLFCIHLSQFLITWLVNEPRSMSNVISSSQFEEVRRLKGT